MAEVLRLMGGLGSLSPDLAADTRLADAGVDSFAAAELSRQLAELTGVPFSPETLGAHDSPRAICAYARQAAAPAVSARDEAVPAATAEGALSPRRAPVLSPAMVKAIVYSALAALTLAIFVAVLMLAPEE